MEWQSVPAAQSFARVLAGLTGTKESISGAAQLFLASGPHEAASLVAALCARGAEINRGDFTARLRLVYVANDALFAVASSAQHAVHAAALRNALPTLVALAADGAPDAAASARLTALTDFWSARGVVDAHLADTLRAACARHGAPPLPAAERSILPQPLPGTTPQPPAVPLAHDSSFPPVGAIPALVRRRRAAGATGAYTPLTVQDASDVTFARPCSDYITSRLDRFYEELHETDAAHISLQRASIQRDRGPSTASKPDPVSNTFADGTLPGGGGDHGHGGLGTSAPADAADAFRRSRSAAYHSMIVGGR